MVFIAIVCLQCFASGYMDTRKPTKAVPVWMNYLIDFSLLRIPILAEEPLDDEIEESNRIEQEKISLSTGSANPESRNKGGGIIPLQTLNPLSTSSEVKPDEEEDAAGGCGEAAAAANKETLPLDELLPSLKKKYTWQRGSRSFDRICRIVIPVLFALFVSVELALVN
jgi:hypothetical protein